MAEPSSNDNPCKKNRKCSKLAGHKGRCNTQKEVNHFWESSAFYQLNAKKRKFQEEERSSQQELDSRELALQERVDRLSSSEEEIQYMLQENGMTFKIIY